MGTGVEIFGGVTSSSQHTAYNQLSMVEDTPVSQILAVNGLTDQTVEFVFGTGTTVAEDSPGGTARRF